VTEGPYELPEGWRWVRLGEVAEVCYGKANPKKPGVVPVVGSSGVYDYTASPLISFPTVVVGRKGNAGEAVLVKEPCWPSDTVFYLRWQVDVSPEWVAIWLKVHKPSSEGTSPTLPSLRREELERHLIPLPPLAEQERIVKRLEALMDRVREARRLRREAREEAERLWQSVLADTFPRPGSPLPPGWRWVKLEEVSQHKTGIWGPEATDTNKGFPIVRSTEIEGMSLRPQSAAVRSIPPEKVSAYKLETGDIVVNKSSGSPHLVGWPAIFEGPRDGRVYLFSNFMLRIRADKNFLNPWYLLYYLHSPIARAVYLRAQDTTSGLRNLRVTDFMAQPTPLPPLSEQRRIVERLEALQEKLRALEAAQAQTDETLKRLEQAVLEKAFRGEL
jgi:type I restriction enzyme S subunit